MAIVFRIIYCVSLFWSLFDAMYFKITMLNVNFETYLERNNPGYYLDSKFIDEAFCDDNLHVKEIASTKQHYHTEW